MCEKLYDFATQKAAIAGRFEQDYELTLLWLPYFLINFREATRNINLNWEKCKFVEANRAMIPSSHGVYCFSVKLGHPLPDKFHVPLYIGKAADQYICERFQDYLGERVSIKGRKQIVYILNRYKNDLFFWWATLPRIYVDVVEEHLLMSCKPPCNTKTPSRAKMWGKAFD